MGSLYIEKDNIEIRVEGKALVFYENGERQGSAPINPVDRVIIIGNKKLDTSVLGRLAEHNVSVIFLSGRRMAFRGILHGRYHNNGLLRVQQYKKSLDSFSIAYAKEIITAKLNNQISVINELKSLIPNKSFEFYNSLESLQRTLKKIPEQNSNDSIRGLEGSAANVYFKAYSLAFPESLGFHGRERRPPGDPVNALLSLSYTLLHFEMVREIEIIGLDPTIGFYHSFEYGRESLACDLVEEFRPEVDKYVFCLFRNRILRSDDFTFFKDNGRRGCYLKKSKRKVYYTSYEDWVRPFRTKFTEKVQELSQRLIHD